MNNYKTGKPITQKDLDAYEAAKHDLTLAVRKRDVTAMAKYQKFSEALDKVTVACITTEGDGE